MPTRTFGVRLRAAREAAGLTLEAVGKRVGVSTQAVYKWEVGKAKPSADRLADIAKVIGTSVNFLLTGQQETIQTEHNSGRVGRRTVPVFMAEDVAAGRFDDVKGRVDTHFPCSPAAFVIILWDQSNASRFEKGDQVVIDPGLAPEPGDMVLAEIGGDHKPVFAQYASRQHNSARIPVLKHLNDLWGEHVISDASAGRIIGVMTEHATPRRR